MHQPSCQEEFQLVQHVYNVGSVPDLVLKVLTFELLTTLFGIVKIWWKGLWRSNITHYISQNLLYIMQYLIMSHAFLKVVAICNVWIDILGIAS